VKSRIFRKFEILALELLKIQAFWDIMMYRLIRSIVFTRW